MKSGDVFGVMSLLTGDRIVADVIAGNRCFVLMIPQEVFNTHILTNPKAVGYLSRLLAERTRAHVGRPRQPARPVPPSRSDDPYALSLNTDAPGKVVVLNVGVSQIHFGIYDTQDSGADVHGIIDNADQQLPRITVMVGPRHKTLAHEPFKLSDIFKVMQEATALLGEAFTFHPEDVTAVGHRVVHGGNQFSSSVVITPAVIADIEELAIFAPLHNPANVAGIRVAHETVPRRAAGRRLRYRLPPDAAALRLPLRPALRSLQAGRHPPLRLPRHLAPLRLAEGGGSAQASARRAGNRLLPPRHRRLAVRHRPRTLGRYQHGHDTDRRSDHAQPLRQHRPGGDDPPDAEPRNVARCNCRRLINTESGLKGISGISSDIHDIEAAAGDGHHRALLAHKAFCYQVRKNIGAYVAAMGGIDVLAFTGDIGETSATVRSLACQGLGYMGIKLDEEKNRNLDHG